MVRFGIQSGGQSYGVDFLAARGAILKMGMQNVHAGKCEDVGDNGELVASLCAVAQIEHQRGQA